MFSYYVLNALYTLFRIYSVCIVVWCLSSWITVSNDSVRNILEAIGKIVEPYLSVFRRAIPPISGVDLSPIIALFVLNLVERLAISTLGLILIFNYKLSSYDVWYVYSQTEREQRWQSHQQTSSSRHSLLLRPATIQRKLTHFLSSSLLRLMQCFKRSLTSRAV